MLSAVDSCIDEGASERPSSHTLNCRARNWNCEVGMGRMRRAARNLLKEVRIASGWTCSGDEEGQSG